MSPPDARWRALIVLTLARASMGFQFQSIAAVSPLLIEDLALDYADVGFLIGLYMLPGVLLAVPGGFLGRQFGDKRVALVGLGLMTLGGLACGLAEGHAGLLAGRLASGLGAVLLSVLMTKMITDWFAGHEIVLAMSVFINAFPIGIGLALLTLGGLAEHSGWPAAFQATVVMSLAALLLIALAYRRHPNDGRLGLIDRPQSGISRPEVVLVCLAGINWGLYNAMLAIVLGFTPLLLASRGMAVAVAGSRVSLVTWLMVGSVQAGGLVAQRWRHPDRLLVAGCAACGLCLLLLPVAPPLLAIVALGLCIGLPAAVIIALPAEVLRPGSRALGMGLFYIWLYAGFAFLPPVAGWLQDLTASPAAPLWFASALMFAILPVLGAFRALQDRIAVPAPARPG